jgi:hypothetical protein
MSEKFYIEVSDFGFIGGMHYYGHVRVPDTRLSEGQWHPLEELSRKGSIKFWTVTEIIEAAKEWFLKDSRVKPGDKLVISRDLWEIRNEPLESEE